jgi:tRNA/tmRNA/rRNA uracil-C5-methylase (TrmA/RlmC/RlmD family)
MDLFCGTGTIGQILANQIPGAEVIGVDIVPEAIEDAKKNAERNSVTGLKFFAADVGKFLQEYPQYKDNISTVVLDPPRAGIAPKTLKKVVQLNASRIVYVSCNPATQARDTEYLLSEGYQLKKISFADQFPHTSHVESIALFERPLLY